MEELSAIGGGSGRKAVFILESYFPVSPHPGCRVALGAFICILRLGFGLIWVRERGTLTR